MRLHLVSPSHYLPDGSLHKTTRYWTSGITLPYLKALTPAPHRVEFTDELMGDLDLARIEREADVVGLTAMGPQIRRAYDLADHFRARGIYRAARWHDLKNLPSIDPWSLPLLKPDTFRSSWLYRMYFYWPILFS